MIIGFLGKGGSGKSTVSTKLALYLHQKNMQVLAIDADHNMDLSFNLGAPETMNYIGEKSLYGIAEYLQEPKDVAHILTTTKKRFMLTPPDAWTKEYTSTTQSGISIMAAGPQQHSTIHEGTCSHALASALKVYLPLLTLQENEFVIVDEKASVDAVTTGIPNGFHMAVVVVENTPHSIKAANQIADVLRIYNVPFVFWGNKITNLEEEKNLREKIPIMYTMYMNSAIEENAGIFDGLIMYAKNVVEQQGDARMERSIKRYSYSK